MSIDNRTDVTTNDAAEVAGTAAGGLGGAALGAAVGSVAGPLGTLLGGAVGAVMGGAAGNAAAESLDPMAEDTHWRTNHTASSYYTDSYNYDNDYRPAYAVGYANRHRYDANARFEDVETELEQSWNQVKGDSKLAWSDARHAARDAWYRIAPENR